MAVTNENETTHWLKILCESEGCEAEIGWLVDIFLEKSYKQDLDTKSMIVIGYDSKDRRYCSQELKLMTPTRVIGYRNSLLSANNSRRLSFPIINW